MKNFISLVTSRPSKKTTAGRLAEGFHARADEVGGQAPSPLEGHLHGLDREKGEVRKPPLEEGDGPAVGRLALLGARMEEALPGVDVVRGPHEGERGGLPVPLPLLRLAPGGHDLPHPVPLREPRGPVPLPALEGGADPVDLADLAPAPGRGAHRDERRRGPGVIFGKKHEPVLLRHPALLRGSSGRPRGRASSAHGGTQEATSAHSIRFSRNGKTPKKRKSPAAHGGREVCGRDGSICAIQPERRRGGAPPAGGNG